MNSRRAIIVGVGIGATMLIWIVVVIVLRQTGSESKTDTKSPPTTPQQTPSPKIEPITVSPRVINLYTSKGSSQLQRVFVHNTASVAYHSIWVKVAIESPAINPSSIRMSTGKVIEVKPKQPHELLQDYDAIMIATARPEANGLAFLVSNIAPNETKTFLLSRQDDGKELSPSEKHQAVLSIEKFATEPPQSALNIGPQLLDMRFADQPHIILKSVTFEQFRPGIKLITDITWINIGGKAAIEPTAKVMFSELATTLTDLDAKLAKSEGTLSLNTLSAASERVYRFNRGPMAQDLFDKIKNGTINLYFIALINYMDEAGKPYQDKFCVRFRPDEDRWHPCDSKELPAAKAN
jgi:hypothetical protein